MSFCSVEQLELALLRQSRANLLFMEAMGWNIFRISIYHYCFDEDDSLWSAVYANVTNKNKNSSAFICGKTALASSFLFALAKVCKVDIDAGILVGTRKEWSYGVTVYT